MISRRLFHAKEEADRFDGGLRVISTANIEHAINVEGKIADRCPYEPSRVPVVVEEARRRPVHPEQLGRWESIQHCIARCSHCGDTGRLASLSTHWCTIAGVTRIAIINFA